MPYSDRRIRADAHLTFADTDVTEYWAAVDGSLRLDAGELHHFGPLLGFAGEETAEVGGRAGQHRSTHVGQSRLRLGVGEDCINLHVEPPDDLRRRVPRRR